MQRFKVHTAYKKVIADMLTPVSIYLQLRDHFPGCIMLESSDYHGTEHNYSYICIDPLGGFRVENDEFVVDFGEIERSSLATEPLTDRVNDLLRRFEQRENINLPFIHSGFFGFITYECIRHFEQITLRHQPPAFPVMQYRFYRYIFAFNHFNNELYLVQNDIEGAGTPSRNIDEVLEMIFRVQAPALKFERAGEKLTNVTDEQFLENVRRGIYHCRRGDVFQIVLSRRFRQGFKGDDFQVYRTLRSVNPSPYLFYFDYGKYKIFGSSPEAQLIIRNEQVTIHPIAGTFRRTGDDKKDLELAQKLVDDPKENAEHIMLVDLARNDLSRNGDHVHVEVYREVQFYSHVIHLVSKVTSHIAPDANKFKIVGDTFPAGTLSGAPKYKAMELIDKYETTGRSFYGGAIGHLGLNGDFNHAIMIRSFLSENNTLTYQAGAGVVVDSVPENELQEVENKLAALNRALEMAENI